MPTLAKYNAALVLAVALAMLAAACGSGGAVPGGAPEQPETLTDPPIVDSPFSGSLADVLTGWKEPAAGILPGDRRLPAGDYDKSLPYKRVSGDPRVVFAPEAGSHGTWECAYCFYVMPLPDYDEPVELMLDWHLPPEWSRLWIGVADFGHGNWFWQQGGDIGPYVLGEPADVLTEEGNLIFAVLLTGTATCELDYVMIGDNLPPTAELRVDPVEGPAGEVFLYATKNKDPEGAPLHYEFDTDGDGTFETDTGDRDFLLTELTEPGVHLVGLRVTDDAGAYCQDFGEVTINNWTAETIAAAGDRRFNLAQDSDGAVHVAYIAFDLVEPYFSEDLAYATNREGSWTVETVRETDDEHYYWRPDVAVDSGGRPWILAANYGGPEVPLWLRFYVRDDGTWTEQPELAFETEYNLNMLTLRLDSNDHPHVVDGNDGQAEGNGAFSYHFHDGSDWVHALSWVRATSADLELTSDDQPIILLHHYDLKSLLVCERSGGGWGFRIEQEHAGIETMVLDSSDYVKAAYARYDYSEPYDPELVQLEYDWHTVFRVPEELRYDTGIDSDLLLDGSDTAHIAFEWRGAYSTWGYQAEWAVARGDHYPFELEWFRKGQDTRCMRIALDEQGDEMVFSTLSTEFRTESARGTYWRLVLHRPGS